MYVYIYALCTSTFAFETQFGPGGVDLRDPGQDILATAGPER